MKAILGCFPGDAAARELNVTLDVHVLRNKTDIFPSSFSVRMRKQPSYRKIGETFDWLIMGRGGVTDPFPGQQ